MLLPSFVQRSPGASNAFLVDIPRDLDELVAWMYVLSKGSHFPVELNVLGRRECFGCMEEMLGFIMGVKRTSDVFRASTPVAQ